MRMNMYEPNIRTYVQDITLHMMYVCPYVRMYVCMYTNQNTRCYIGKYTI